MKLYILFSVFTSSLIWYFFSASFTHAHLIQKIWFWNKLEKTGQKNDVRFLSNPFEELNGYKIKSELVVFPFGEKIAFDNNDRIEYPLLGDGYVKYKKIGNSISYYSSQNEILWEKKTSSYPKFTNDGTFIFLISGDQNKVQLFDVNGNDYLKTKIEGRFLIDTFFSNKLGSSYLLFSGGEFYRINSKGLISSQKNFGSNEVLRFFKSISASPSEKFFAIHFFEKNIDIIRVYDGLVEEVYQIQLDKTYPHKLYFSLSDEGELLVRYPEKIVLYDSDGDAILALNSKNQSNYHLSFSTGNIFISENNGYLLFVNPKGEILKKIPVENSDNQLRAFFSKKENLIYIESFQKIWQFVIIPLQK